MKHISQVPNIMFDADVIISGSFSQNGASFILLQLSELGLLNGYITRQVQTECERNLNLKLPSGIPIFQRFIDNAVTILENPEPIDIKKYEGNAHENDLPILVAAIQNNIKFLVTFNKNDYYPSHEYDIEIINPGDCLKKIRFLISKIEN